MIYCKNFGIVLGATQAERKAALCAGGAKWIRLILLGHSPVNPGSVFFPAEFMFFVTASFRVSFSCFFYVDFEFCCLCFM